ncbi:DUF6461 domain-containing protein [Streptomyces sp. NPDC001339]|uniref:DUF6461 domain-containing protein n=1 Tax=Streptomyces sp. NPDC001339 TaxID=3364563 RepID=UPI0036B97AF2
MSGLWLGRTGSSASTAAVITRVLNLVNAERVRACTLIIPHFLRAGSTGSFSWCGTAAALGRPAVVPCCDPRPARCTRAAFRGRPLWPPLRQESAAFALAAHVTGVANTPMLLQDTTFTCATVQIR